MPKTITCEHGTQTIPDSVATSWNGPIGRCGCCDRNFTYLNQGSISTEGGSSTFWYPMDRCSTCGGKYVEQIWGKIIPEEAHRHATLVVVSTPSAPDDFLQALWRCKRESSIDDQEDNRK